MSSPPSGEITRLLKQVSSGDEAASERLAETVYAELRRIAARLMAHERPGHTLQPTALAGEAYLNLVDQHQRNWQNRAHFFAVAAQAMRRLLIDYARSARATKRGGLLRRVELDGTERRDADPYEDVLTVHDALERLTAIDSRQARIVELRYFGGLTEQETAAALDISVRTVKRDWAVARAWLYADLTRPAALADRTS